MVLWNINCEWRKCFFFPFLKILSFPFWVLGENKTSTQCPGLADDWALSSGVHSPYSQGLGHNSKLPLGESCASSRKQVCLIEGVDRHCCQKNGNAQSECSFTFMKAMADRLDKIMLI